MRHRNAEVKALQEILNSEDFEDDVAMAKACIEKVYELFQLRDWYGLRWGDNAYGPYIDKAEAGRAAAQMEGLPTVHSMTAPATFASYVRKMENPVARAYCDECKHPRFAHGFTNHRGCVVRKPSPCPCPQMFK